MFTNTSQTATEFIPLIPTLWDLVRLYNILCYRYRYTEWVKYRSYPHYKPVWKDVFKGPSIELYDHKKDPQENKNIALESEQKSLVKSLSKMLHAGWRKQIPVL